jgi:hypothetical protein
MGSSVNPVFQIVSNPFAYSYLLPDSSKKTAGTGPPAVFAAEKDRIPAVVKTGSLPKKWAWRGFHAGRFIRRFASVKIPAHPIRAVPEALSHAREAEPPGRHSQAEPGNE